MLTVENNFATLSPEQDRALDQAEERMRQHWDMVRWEQQVEAATAAARVGKLWKATGTAAREYPAAAAPRKGQAALPPLPRIVSAAGTAVCIERLRRGVKG